MVRSATAGIGNGKQHSTAAQRSAAATNETQGRQISSFVFADTCLSLALRLRLQMNHKGKHSGGVNVRYYEDSVTHALFESVRSWLASKQVRS